MRLHPLALAPLLLLTAACAEQRPLYHWDGYDQRLYQHYRSPQDSEAWVSGMREVVLAAEQQGRKVPPGVYAEYGYALLEQGDTSAAISSFEKERARWPESAALMDKMIENARRIGAKGSSAPPSVRPGAPEGRAP